MRPHVRYSYRGSEFLEKGKARQCASARIKPSFAKLFAGPSQCSKAEALSACWQASAERTQIF